MKSISFDHHRTDSLQLKVAKLNNSMEKTKPLLFFIFFFFFFFLFRSISGDDDCGPATCSLTGPQVRFPFRLRDRQPSRCGFPGFDLSCNEKNQTLLTLPSSPSSFIVKRIIYAVQVVAVEPDFCRPERVTDIRLTGTPFDSSFMGNYTFFNCSSQNLRLKSQTLSILAFPCVNHSVFAVRAGWVRYGDIPASCRAMKTISVPVRRFGYIGNELTLTWSRPKCASCELYGGTCGFKSDDGEIACFDSLSDGIMRVAKYGLSIGVGVGLGVGLICYACSKARTYNHSRRRQSIDLFSIAIIPQPPTTTGLDEPTIESCLTTILGESCRLPKDDDDTCPICLLDYEPKEAVRTILQCNHYFHTECIEEWLKLNATCPVCRCSTQSSSLATPSSLMSSDSSHTTNR